MNLIWKLESFLEEHQITRYRLAKESGLSNQTVYALTSREVKALQLAPLMKIVAALRSLTGKPISVSDLLEYTED